MRARRFSSAALLVAMCLAAAHAGDLYKDEETYEAENLVVVTRPGRDWVFIDLDEQRRQLGTELTAYDLQAKFQGLLCRLHHPGMKATVSVFAFDLPDGVDLAAQEAALKEQLSRGGARLLGAGRGVLKKREVLQTDYEVEVKAIGGQPGGTYHVRRIDWLRPDVKKHLVLVLEVPKEERKQALSEHKALLKKLKL